MHLTFFAILIMFFGGIAALLAGSRARFAGKLGVAGAVLGSVIGLIPAVQIFLGAPAEKFHAPWQVPYGSFSLGLDALSAFFLIPIFILVALCAIYGASYLQKHDGGRAAGPAWFFYSLLAVSMVVVVLARNGILFLFAWELMSISSYFLVTHDDGREHVRAAGWTYLVAAHLGTAFLFAFFAVMAHETGTLDFDGWGSVVAMPHATTGLLFICAIIGFGTKAGFMPLHVWLPEAHPAAPSHVSALMSGVMIKTGIYGIVRMATYLGAPPVWWGELLICIGVASGILGVLYALAQHDIKSLLAYHSVENIGIIALGLGLGFLGLAAGEPVAALLGFAGGLLHVLNHALFKGLLFLGAGAVITATHTGEIDKQGGLFKRMPRTGLAFLTGSVAISGLPPLNGFISEFLIFLSALAFIGSGQSSVTTFWPAVIVIASLALIGGLASACFTKAFGVIFLGSPRSDAAKEACEVSVKMWAPMFILAAACAVVGFAAPVFLRSFWPTLSGITGQTLLQVNGIMGKAGDTLAIVVACFAGLALAVFAILLLRGKLLKRRGVRRAITWDCGYAQSTPRMQYTSSSFAEPFTAFFKTLLYVQTRGGTVRGIFPKSSSLETNARDIFREIFFIPLFRVTGRSLSLLKWLQHGNVHLYVLYIAITLIVLLIWKFGVL